MSKLDDYEVARLDGVDESGEAGLVVRGGSASRVHEVLTVRSRRRSESFRLRQPSLRLEC